MGEDDEDDYENGDSGTLDGSQLDEGDSQLAWNMDEDGSKLQSEIPNGRASRSGRRCQPTRRIFNEEYGFNSADGSLMLGEPEVKRPRGRPPRSTSVAAR